MTDERVQRRLAAILSADVVGYSRLMRADEEGTFERIRAHRKELFEPEIKRHRGRIFKLMGMVSSQSLAVLWTRYIAQLSCNVRCFKAIALVLMSVASMCALVLIWAT